jgi:hypothetical protein
MTQLQQAHHFLMASLQTDPLFKIAHAVSFFDPLWCDGDFYEEDTFATALHICRRTFPDLYVEVLQALRKGRDDAYVEHIICDGITAFGIPLDHIEYMGWGIPLPAYGVELDDPDLMHNYPELAPVLACFGMEQGDVDDEGHLETLCPYLVPSLEKAEGDWGNVRLLLLWLINQTGCTLTDVSYEILCEFEPLQWDVDLEVAVAFIQEADEIMKQVNDALQFLQTHPTALQTLSDNVERLQAALKKGEKYAHRYRLQWTE